jgi:hypothetical protein
MEDIKERAKSIIENINSAINWANSQEDDIKKSSLENMLKSLHRSITKIDKAVQKRPSIAIFGQSQVGKSYLVQNLAKPEDEQFLKINAGKNLKEVNFLTDMNPNGGQESTGLVTRFTTQKKDKNPDYPFTIELFGQLDIAAILLNAYWSDLKDYGNVIVQEQIEETLKKVDLLKDKTAYIDVDEYDIYYFIEYISNNFSDVFVIRDLQKTGYFKVMFNQLKNIRYDKRWEVLQILWGNNKFITEVFKMLSEGIAKLNFQKNIAVSIDALSPNSITILDVERVKELFDDEKNINEINAITEDNKKISINRSVFSIITKEVCLELSNAFENDDNRSFMNKSDLLDFPGSKSRDIIPLSVFNANTSKQKLQLLIRGKVSYLFDTYTNQLGVNTLLYCMDDNPPEEKEAPSRLYNWVKRYIGDSKKERSNKLSKTLEILKKTELSPKEVSPLLIVLTKFNQEINKVIRGKETSIEIHDSKWEARINTNFVDFMSNPVEENWILNWTETQEKFNFIFPIRDPMYSQATFEGYETENKELKIRPERKEAMSSIGISFHGSNVTQDHIINVNEAWAELSSPNGTGISYLAKHLKNSANPEVTKIRLEFELDKINRELKGVLKPHLVSGNIEEDLKKAKIDSNITFTSSIAMANRQDNVLSKLMSKMIVSDTEIWNIVYENIFENNKINGVEETNEHHVDIVQSFLDLGVEIKEDTTQKEIIHQLSDIYDGLDYNEIKKIIKDFINFDIANLDQILTNKNINTSNSLADLIIKFWVNKVVNVTMSNHLVSNLSDKYIDAFRSQINQILKSRDRLKIKEKILEIISEVKSGNINQEDIDLVASCCSTILNNFLFSAGWLYANEANKPIQKHNSQTIFSAYAREYDINNLNYNENLSSKVYFKEWCLGCKNIFEENVKYDYGVEGNLNAANNKLLDKIVSNI